MGIVKKVIEEITCDKCKQHVKDYFSGTHTVIHWTDRDVSCYSNVKIETTVDYGGKQIICNKCAVDILKAVIKELEL